MSKADLLTASEVKNRVVEVKRVRFADVANHPLNPKFHPDNQRLAFRGSVREVGFTSVPVAYVNEAGVLTWCDGHLRGSELADYVGDVAILDISDAEAAKILAYQDPIAALAELDKEKLDVLLRQVNSDNEAIQQMLASMAAEAGLYVKPEPAQDPGPQIDKAAELQEKWKVKPGDLWQIGAHRLICGDCTDKATVERLMDGEKADMVFTDPPYGVDYSGGRNPESNTPREKLQGDKTGDMYLPSLRSLKSVCAEHAPMYIWFASTVGKPVYDAVEAIDYTVRAMIVWNKLDAHYGNFMAQYMQKHEPCLYIVNGNPDWCGPTNEVTVWDVKQPTINEFHPTQKPVELANRAIGNHAAKIVADFFAGSGTTGVACEQLGRQARMVEISQAYCAVILERLSTVVGETPVLLEQ